MGSIVDTSSYGPSASGTTHDFTLTPPTLAAECQRLELDFSSSPGACAWWVGRGESSGSPTLRQISGTVTASQVPSGAWGATAGLSGAPLAAPSYLRVTTVSTCTVTVRLVAVRR